MADALIWFVIFFVCLCFYEVVSMRKRLDLRLAALQQQLNEISAHLGLKRGDEVPIGVVGLLQAGRKIEAIKVYREATGAGLADAKAAVERIAAQAGTIIQP